ncbi:MAG: hypothetical protein C4K47_02930 [Candidatus Thorarchaeota archaeon]|nr:MAG: hypothetical protein C4K47_02930 [Candidatus Thorarchaeota archaeon]
MNVDATRTRRLANIAVVLSFLTFMVFSLVLDISGLAWISLGDDVFHFWAVILTGLTMAVSGATLTDSLLYYSQLKNVRRLVILFMAADALILAMLYILSHPSSVGWSPIFADRARNRTITTTFGLALAPGALLSSFAGNAAATRRNTVLYSLWGGLFIPVFGLLCFFSPSPLLVLTSPEGGLGGLTIAGWAVAILAPLFIVIAFVRLVAEYRQSRDLVVLAFALALLLWATASLNLSVLWNPDQVAEILYMTDAMAGMTLIGMAMVMDAIVEPFRTLETVIHKRTQELEDSKSETEFFLSAWTHKVGNMLQGITTYLDLVGYATTKGESMVSSQKEAAQLNWEAKIFNRQVAWLSQVKSSSKSTLVPVSLDLAISKAASSIMELAETRNILITPSDEEVKVLADENLDLLFAGLFSHCVLPPRTHTASVAVKYTREKDSIAVELNVKTGASAREMAEFLRSRSLPTISKLDLDMYMTRLLLNRYGVLVESRGGNDQSLVLRFMPSTK